ncbi:MAG: hypothetical protein H7Y27_13845 [Gemmatimonadaceae bacterium]|nr:hypothetical protein [Chitinophagaceae bacterium]
MKRFLPLAEILIIVAIACFPLVAGNFPYRLNIFLSYEGAYRMSEGHIPYRDFGTPLGYMYWVVPAIFFKIFGPFMMSLVKAQVFLNIIAGLSFRSILKNFSLRDGMRFLLVLLFVISYSFLNYWPWYNHTVIVYELVALSFLTKFIFNEGKKWRYAWLVLSGVFTFFSFFTKQDGGGMALMICLVLVLYNAIHEKSWKQPLVFISGFILTGVLLIAPFIKYRFGYWFNHGQPPHISRFSVADLADDFFNNSQFIKFYIFIIFILLLAHIKSFKTFWQDKYKMVFTLLTLGILAEAAIFQTTSYIPPDNNIFFHSFAIAFILAMSAYFLPIDYSKWKTIIVAGAGIMIWWSSVYWKYIEKFVVKPQAITTTDGVVNKKTYLILKPDTTDVPMHLWRTVPYPAFGKMLLPGPTADGIERLLKMDVARKPGAKVLNMSELTPLVQVMKYELEKNDEYPLWYHKGVGMFQKETDMFNDRIRKNYYDLVIFEYIPYLNNFYPMEVRETLLANYERVDSFTAPRKPSLQAWVEVYVRKSAK